MQLLHYFYIPVSVRVRLGFGIYPSILHSTTTYLSLSYTYFDCVHTIYIVRVYT